MPRTKNTRRDNLEGSLRQRADGRYEARVLLAGKHISVYDFDPKRAMSKLREKVKLFEQGFSPSSLTVGHWFTAGKSKEELLQDSSRGIGCWLERKRFELQESTYRNYINDYFFYIEPYLAGIVLDPMALSTKIIKDWQLTLGQKISAYTANRAKDLLSNALGDVVESGIMPFNPAQPIKNLKHEKKVKDIWSADEISAVLAASQGTRGHALYAIGVMLGLRPQELLALQWSKIEFFDKYAKKEDAGRVLVDQAVKARPGGGVMLATPKNSYSIRHIGFRASVKGILAQHAELLLTIAERESLWVSHDLVFPGETGRIQDDTRARKDMMAICAKTGAKYIGLQGLRHTFASIMIAKNVSPVELSKLMGHERPDTTYRVYAHLFELKSRRPMPELSDILG